MGAVELELQMLFVVHFVAEYTDDMQGGVVDAVKNQVAAPMMTPVSLAHLITGRSKVWIVGNRYEHVGHTVNIMVGLPLAPVG